MDYLIEIMLHNLRDLPSSMIKFQPIIRRFEMLGEDEECNWLRPYKALARTMLDSNFEDLLQKNPSITVENIENNIDPNEINSPIEKKDNPKITKKKVGRPADPKITERNKRINRTYYHLTTKKCLNKKEAIRQLSAKYKLAISTIEKYLK